MITKISLVLGTLAVVGTSAPAVATDAPKRGHFEWLHSPQPGPNKSNLPNYRRIWIADSAPDVTVDEGRCMTMACCNADEKQA